jgi:hypothetical protein
MVGWFHCFWAQGKVEYHSIECVVEQICSHHSTQGSRQRHRKRSDQEEGIFFKGIPSDLLPPTRPYHLIVNAGMNSSMG